jgi:leucyl-tRNA synthetase
MVLNDIFQRKSDKGGIAFFAPEEIDVETDADGRVTGARAKSDGQPVEYAGLGTMSKSKRNGVDPQDLIEKYGADTARFFIIFTSPPEQTLAWSDSGVEGSFRFLRKLWAFACAYAETVRPGLPAARTLAAGAKLEQSLAAARREVHLNLKQANYDMQRQQFNTVASACMKILNALEDVPRGRGGAQAEVLEEGLSILLRLQAPITPHICFHLWRELGFGADVFAAPWPEATDSALQQDEVELVLQINGKTRGSVMVPSTADKLMIEKLAVDSPVAQKYIAGQAVKKTVVVPGRLVNIVV